MESGKHKKRVSYTVMIVSDSPYGGSHPFYLKQGLLTTILGLVVVILKGTDRGADTAKSGTHNR